MATYLDTLRADRERLRRALTALIQGEAAAVRDLQADVETHARKLDEQIVRLMVLRGIYGPSSAESFAAQTDVEESSKPHTAALQELATHQRILQALQEALIRLDQGQAIDVATESGEGKLTVADILGE